MVKFTIGTIETFTLKIGSEESRTLLGLNAKEFEWYGSGS